MTLNSLVSLGIVGGTILSIHSSLIVHTPSGERIYAGVSASGEKDTYSALAKVYVSVACNSKVVADAKKDFNRPLQ